MNDREPKAAPSQGGSGDVLSPQATCSVTERCSDCREVEATEDVRALVEEARSMQFVSVLSPQHVMQIHALLPRLADALESASTKIAQLEAAIGVENTIALLESASPPARAAKEEKVAAAPLLDASRLPDDIDTMFALLRARHDAAWIVLREHAFPSADVLHSMMVARARIDLIEDVLNTYHMERERELTRAAEEAAKRPTTSEHESAGAVPLDVLRDLDDETVREIANEAMMEPRFIRPVLDSAADVLAAREAAGRGEDGAEGG